MSARDHDLMASGGGAERVDGRRAAILGRYDTRLRAFIDFVLGQYVVQGVGELDQDKLAHLLELKYRTLQDAMGELGGTPVIRAAFLGFRPDLFAR